MPVIRKKPITLFILIKIAVNLPDTINSSHLWPENVIEVVDLTASHGIVAHSIRAQLHENLPTHAPNPIYPFHSNHLPGNAEQQQKLNLWANFVN